MAVNIYQQETIGERAKDKATGLVEPKRGYRRLFRSISHVFSSGSNHQNQHQHHPKPESLPYQSRTHSRSHSDTQSHNSYVSQLNNSNNNNNNNNNDNNSNNENNNNNNENNTDNREGSPIQNVKFRRKIEDCSECGEHGKGQDMKSNHADVVQELNAVFAVDKRLRRQTIVPVSDIRRAQQIEEDNEVQQTQQISKSQRFKSASIGNLVDLPGEDDKKSIKNRMRMKFAPSNVFRIRGDKKSRSRRSQVNSLCLDEQSKYPLFGARLNALELNMSDHPYVPRFVVDVCAHIERPDAIEQDGLYRASGNKLLVDELKLKLTHLYDPRWLQTDDIHTLTSLHKQFFRELPAPLITQEAYERLGRLTDEAAIERMRLAFDEMPEPNRSTLRFLIKHLTNVAAASGSNRMPASNLAIVWGPCLLAANVINFDIGRMNMLAKMLIENYERIFRPDNERLVC